MLATSESIGLNLLTHLREALRGYGSCFQEDPILESLRYFTRRNELLVRRMKPVNTPGYLVDYSMVVVVVGHIDIDFIKREHNCINSGKDLRFLLLELVLELSFSSSTVLFSSVLTEKFLLPSMPGMMQNSFGIEWWMGPSGHHLPLVARL